jgi:hypothetical protein
LSVALSIFQLKAAPSSVGATVKAGNGGIEQREGRRSDPGLPRLDKNQDMKRKLIGAGVEWDADPGGLAPPTLGC